SSSVIACLLLSVPLPRLHPKSGLPDFAAIDRPKSDKSDFGWRVGRGISPRAPSKWLPPLQLSPASGGEGASAVLTSHAIFQGRRGRIAVTAQRLALRPGALLFALGALGAALVFLATLAALAFGGAAAFFAHSRCEASRAPSASAANFA